MWKLFFALGKWSLSDKNDLEAELKNPSVTRHTYFVAAYS